MCDDHSGVLIDIPTASRNYPDGRPRLNGSKRGIDACIATLVKVLNEGGFGTVASCCGHGKSSGNIALADGRELVIAPDFETARRIDAALGADDDGCQCPACVEGPRHWSDCAVHNEPAYPKGPCSCAAGGDDE